MSTPSMALRLDHHQNRLTYESSTLLSHHRTLPGVWAGRRRRPAARPGTGYPGERHQLGTVPSWLACGPAVGTAVHWTEQRRPLRLRCGWPATGHCRQFPGGAAQADFPTASLRSQTTGILYIGSAWLGHLHRYDPAHPERAVGRPGRDRFRARYLSVRGTQEAPDGSLYIGSYPEANLTRYDPATGQFTRFGRIDETDKYLYPLVGDDGTLAMQVKMTRYFVVAMDLRRARAPPGRAYGKLAHGFRRPDSSILQGGRWKSLPRHRRGWLPYQGDAGHAGDHTAGTPGGRARYATRTTTRRR